MKRIIHMSDLHVGFEDLGDRFRAIVQRLIFEKGDKPGHYVIVVTGDLVEDANDPVRYDEVKSGFLELRQAGFQHILVVPGNHDYGTGDQGDPKFVAAFQQCFFGGKVTFPKLDIIDGVAFMGLDAMAEELNWYDQLFAEGELGTHQLDRLRRMMRSAAVRGCAKKVVYLHHHPFAPRPFHQLKDSAKLEKIIRGKVDAVLYGHNHQGHVHNGQWGIGRCYDAGTATGKLRSALVSWLPWFTTASATRVIDLERDDAGADYVLDLL